MTWRGQRAELLDHARWLLSHGRAKRDDSIKCRAGAVLWCALTRGQRKAWKAAS